MDNLVKNKRSVHNYEWALAKLKAKVDSGFWGTLIIKMENGVPENIKVEENIKPPKK
jgi:hypothetical protein